MPIVLTSFIWGMYYVATKFANNYETSALVVGIFIRLFAFYYADGSDGEKGEIKTLFKVKVYFYP